jgi:hypothetical protein
MWPAAALLVVSWVTVPFAVDALVAVMTSIRFTVLALVAVFVLNETGTLERLTLPVMVMTVSQAVVGIAQVVQGKSLGLSAVGEWSLSPSMPVSVVTATDGTRYLRAYGLTDHPNILGGILVFGVIVLVGAAWGRNDELGFAARLAAAVGCAGLLVTFSRGAIIGMAAAIVTMVVLLYMVRDRIAMVRLGGTALAGVVLAAPLALAFTPALAARSDGAGSIATETRSINERIAVSNATADLVAAHPFGVGAGGLPEAMRMAQPAFAYTYQPSNVVLLDATAETGMAGGAAYMVLLVAPWVALLRIRGRWTREVITASALLAASTVIGVFDYYTWSYSAGRIWMWVCLGLWALAYQRARSGAGDAI